MTLRQRRYHPNYDRWVKLWGQMHADDENRAWLDRCRNTTDGRGDKDVPVVTHVLRR